MVVPARSEDLLSAPAIETAGETPGVPAWIMTATFAILGWDDRDGSMTATHRSECRRWS